MVFNVVIFMFHKMDIYNIFFHGVRCGVYYSNQRVSTKLRCNFLCDFLSDCYNFNFLFWFELNFFGIFVVRIFPKQYKC